MPLGTDVLFAGQLSTQDASDIVEDFNMVGLTPELREVPPRRSLDNIAWLILAAVPLKPFFDQLAKDFAADAYRRLQILAEKVLRRLRPRNLSREVLILQDTVSGVQVVLEHDLPGEAYEKLLSFDLTTVHQGPLYYDRRRHQWRSELDEACRAPTSQV